MIQFKDLISRADSPWLQQHIGSLSTRVLQAFLEKGVTLADLRNAFSSLYDPEDFVADAAKRKTFLDLLRPNEALELADLMDRSGGDPYAGLQNTQFAKGSEKFRLFCAFFGIKAREPVVVEQSPSQMTVQPQYGLFPHQQVAVAKVLGMLHSRHSRVVLHMPTGAGKTRMAMHVICRHLNSHPGQIVLWLANSEELCDQAAEEFAKAWSYLGTRETCIYRMWGNRSIDLANVKDGFFVGGFPKLYSLAKSRLADMAKIGDMTSLVVVDEAHQVIAPTYETVIQLVTARVADMPVLGLTATPGRTWNDPSVDQQLADFFQRNKVTLDVPGYPDPVSFLVESGYLAKPQFRTLQSTSSSLSAVEAQALAQELDVPASVLQKLAADEIRSVMIIREVEALCERHRRIIVFATTVAHAGMLAAVLSVRGINAKVVTGDTDPVLRTSTIEWFKTRSNDVRVIVNFGVLTTGFDAPQTSAAVIARPTKSLVLYSQMVGRAIRGAKAGGNDEAEIVTVVDTALPGFGNLSQAFTNWEDVW